ncbi:MAG: Asp23/Gls24 family envelope stress response protein [Firmicutes bacterium]|nr:Asp23/Gls24 family envelope stress response protein [Bacillota bacterium]
MLSNLAGQAAVECYGLVGMSAIGLRDGWAELLKRENLSRGVKIYFKDNHLVVDLYVIVGYGTRIPEVAANVMEKVKYFMEKATGIPVLIVNVHIQGVRVVER